MPYRPERKKRPWERKKVAFEKSQKNQSFYNSKEWRSLSKRFKEKNPFCIKCQEEGIIKATDIADHIVSINNDGPRLEESNLQPLCHFHHNQKSGKEAHGYRQDKDGK